MQDQSVGMQDRGKASGEVGTARAQQADSSWRPSRGVGSGAGSPLWDKRRMTFITFHMGHVPSTACPPVPPPQISADKKTMGRFCGQLGSPLGNPPGSKEFMSQGNKMLLTFHSDFSNEENGTIMFYKGFLAYYQAVGEWCLCWSPGLILNGSRKRGFLNPKIWEACLAFLFFPKRAFSRRELSTRALSPLGRSQKGSEGPAVPGGLR